MGITNISFGNFTDLVFENRNRQYGAYALRTKYSDRLFISCISGIAIILLLVSSPLIANLFRSPVEIVFPDSGPFIVEPPTLKPPVTDQVKETKTGPKPPAQKGAAITGTPSDTASYEPEIDPALGLGDPKGLDSVDFEPIVPPCHDCIPGTITIIKKEKEAERIADKMPEFIGNYKEWLSSHLNYPAIAKDMGTQGTVYVEFIVDEEGNVTNAKLLKDIGHGCGDAALRAVRSMPKWKPGIKSGENVRVYYTLPVKFALR